MISANISNTTRKKVYRRDGFRCALCDSTKYLQIHHAVPRGEGGSDDMQNLITLCADCHALAHGTDLRGYGATQEDVEQAIVEYLADFYGEQGIIWNPWTPDLEELTVKLTTDEVYALQACVLTLEGFELEIFKSLKVDSHALYHKLKALTDKRLNNPH